MDREDSSASLSPQLRRKWPAYASSSQRAVQSKEGVFHLVKQYGSSCLGCGYLEASKKRVLH